MNTVIKTSRLADAFAFANELHASQRRNGTSIPYVSHLMQVAGLVMEAGGDEELAIAALLHDAIEDAPGGDADRVRGQIRRRFGRRVLQIVEGCSDTDVQPKPEWRPRKEAYLRHLRSAHADVVLVSVADKLHTTRRI